MAIKDLLSVGPESNSARLGFSQPDDGVAEQGLYFGPQGDGRIHILEFNQTLSNLAAISTDLNKNFSGIIISAQLLIETLVVAGGTSTRVGIGPVGNPDKYGLTANLLANSTVETLITPAAAVAAEDIQLHMVTNAGGIGNTAASAGKVRVRLTYWKIDALNS